MTDERFKKINHFTIDDTLTDYRPMECASSLDADIVCDFLNWQDKRIKELTEELEDIKSTLIDWMKEFIKIPFIENIFREGVKELSKKELEEVSRWNE